MSHSSPSSRHLTKFGILRRRKILTHVVLASDYWLEKSLKYFNYNNKSICMEPKVIFLFFFIYLSSKLPNYLESKLFYTKQYEPNIQYNFSFQTKLDCMHNWVNYDAKHFKLILFLNYFDSATALSQNYKLFNNLIDCIIYPPLFEAKR